MGGSVAEATWTVLNCLAAAGLPAGVARPGPHASASTEEVAVWPLALLPERVTGPAGDEPLRLRARYLVTSDSPQWTTATVDRVLAALVGDRAVCLVPEPVPTELWVALGAPPRFALLVDVPVAVHRAAPAAPRVTGGLRITETPLRAVRGRVVGPGDVPVPGVRVVAVGFDLAARTDAHGGFAFPGLPAAATRLTVAGKGLRGGVDVPADQSQPVVLHCQYEEV